MVQVAAYSTLAMTVSLAIARPRVSRARIEIGPAAAALFGVLVLLALRVVDFADLSGAARTLWRPLLAVAAILVLAEAARTLGVLEGAAARLLGRPGQPPARAFAATFLLSALVAAALNNDSAVLLLTPLVIAGVRRRWPARPTLLAPFALAVFTAAGVAPLVVSNPMNLIVATSAGIGFNAYALRMVPVALAGGAASFLVLRALFHAELSAPSLELALPAPAKTPPPSFARALVVPRAPSVTRAPVDRWALALLALVLVLYPVVSLLGAPVWPVALGGAAASIALCARRGVAPARLIGGVSWQILAFLAGVFVIGVGLRHAGFVGHVTDLYARVAGAGRATELGVIAAVSAAGSAVVNNHPMAIVNLLALGSGGAPANAHAHARVLAALVGGDLGPRLLPVGSLAGLLWLDALRRARVAMPMRRFLLVGAAVTIPSLVASILALTVVSGW